MKPIGKDKTHYQFDTEGDFASGQGVISLPRVTSILSILSKPELQYWYGKVGIGEAERIRDEAGDFGTNAHKVIQQILLGEKVKPQQWELLSEPVKNSVRAFIRWQRKTDFQPMGIEEVVYSARFGYAGTMDAWGVAGDKYIIADWKTSKAFYPENILQMVAYLVAFKEMFPDSRQIDELRCVRLDKETGNFEEQVLLAAEYQEPFLAFLGLKRAWSYLEKVKGGG